MGHGGDHADDDAEMARGAEEDGRAAPPTEEAGDEQLTLAELDASPLAIPRCPGCGRPVGQTWRFCVYCGDALGRCPACAAERLHVADERYCHACGTPL